MKNSYRKKPVVIEAFQMTEKRRQDNSEWPEWLNAAWQKETGEEGNFGLDHTASGEELLVIETLEGAHIVSYGDFIIQGIRGELYPCKPEIFEDTYDPVEDNA